MTTKSERKTRTTVDTICFKREEAEEWESPKFQRPLRVNQKVLAIVDDIKASGGVVPGVLTLGQVGEKMYLLDGQHRRHAFLLTELKEGYADVRIHTFDSAADMGEEFVKLNTQLVRLRPDDVLRGMEGTSPALRHIRTKCSFVGYDMIRRGDTSPVVSMSTLLRVWLGSAMETPATPSTSAFEIARTVSMDMATECVRFVGLCYDAWGRGEDARRMWGSLNLILCAWLYWRCVVAPPHMMTAAKRWTKLTQEEFKIALMALSADPTYSEWLVGRPLNERNRAPAYARMKNIIALRIAKHRNLTAKVLLPSAPWDHVNSSRK